jgi:Fanconi anemia group M protein
MFHSIFSNKQEPKKESFEEIIIDDREKQSLVPAEIMHLDIPVKFEHLPVADYLIKEIAVERKTISDLKSSIINKRIFLQLKELKQYPKHLLLIEGDKNQLFDNEVLSENALRGFFLAVSLEYQIPLIFTQNEKETALYLSIIAKRKSDKEISIRAKKISLNKAEQVRYILEGFPNIGPAKAKALIEKFGSLKNIFNVSEEELSEILGKNSSLFFDLINHKS